MPAGRVPLITFTLISMMLMPTALLFRHDGDAIEEDKEAQLGIAAR